MNATLWIWAVSHQGAMIPIKNGFVTNIVAVSILYSQLCSLQLKVVCVCLLDEQFNLQNAPFPFHWVVEPLYLMENIPLDVLNSSESSWVLSSVSIDILNFWS